MFFSLAIKFKSGLGAWIFLPSFLLVILMQPPSGSLHLIISRRTNKFLQVSFEKNLKGLATLV